MLCQGILYENRYICSRDLRLAADSAIHFNVIDVGI